MRREGPPVNKPTIAPDPVFLARIPLLSINKVRNEPRLLWQLRTVHQTSASRPADLATGTAQATTDVFCAVLTLSGPSSTERGSQLRVVERQNNNGIELNGEATSSKIGSGLQEERYSKTGPPNNNGGSCASQSLHTTTTIDEAILTADQRVWEALASNGLYGDIDELDWASQTHRLPKRYLVCVSASQRGMCPAMNRGIFQQEKMEGQMERKKKSKRVRGDNSGQVPFDNSAILFPGTTSQNTVYWAWPMPATPGLSKKLHRSNKQSGCPSWQFFHHDVAVSNAFRRPVFTRKLEES
ncbi:uncharacterized protein CLUP02_11689 [Colletotrichum lupini]|uniref:Uncharacterized protein n=1 Tax=Colletotrichum lupini TaxID=145971 RepID=A0A9Q8SYZ8_9PEZI|nr:uncharacterized protein CLUP02_11689 [Colletotrichum lupini]UQC86189.1 hypothetical protein CLUP02_11689 [Colletotrichum lupini]